MAEPADGDAPPASAPTDRHIPVAPQVLYYMAIDGTAAKDSVEYGQLFETHGWQNLATKFLKPAPDDPTRLVDPAHPYLPICLFSSSKGRKIAVVCPGGRDAGGADPFWRRYTGELPEELPSAKHSWMPNPGSLRITFGRHTAAEKSARLVTHLISRPEALTYTKAGENGAPDTSTAELSTGLIDPWEEGTPRRYPADILLVSSHGWLGGFMRGDMVSPWRAAEPVEAREKYLPQLPYYVVGEAASNGTGFAGPAWIILAQCSTVNSATWALWARVLGNSNPHVRGILAYEEVSPGPEGSITIAQKFFAAMTAKPAKTLLESWVEANKNEKWAAIVHQEAIGDKFADWRAFKPLSDVGTTATSGLYRGFLATTPHSLANGGEPVRDAPPPFGFTLESKLPDEAPPKTPPNNYPWGQYLPITPAVLHRAYARIDSAYKYRIVITPPAGAKIVRVAIRWVHIRASFHLQPGPTDLFSEVDLGPNPPAGFLAQFTGKDVMVNSSGGATADRVEVVLTPQTHGRLEKTGMEAHHSYLWPAIDLVTESATIHYDFKTTGLSYYG